MNILHLMPYSPVPPTFGGALREYYLLKSLTREHTVTTITYGTDEQLEMFVNDFGDLVKAIHMIEPPLKQKYKRLFQICSMGRSKSHYYIHNHSERMQRKIDELLAEEHYDAVHCEFSVMGTFDFPENMIRVLDTHNVEYKNFKRMGEKTRSPFRKWFYQREYKKVYEEEVDTLKNQDVIFSTSEADRNTFKQDIPNVPNYVVPNGVDTSYFRPSPWYRTEPHTMVFTGMMGYVPNNDGMLHFLDEIFPRVQARLPDAKIYIVGNRPTEELMKRKTDNIIVTGFVDDVRPFVWRSGVFVVPLRMGSGTRLKVIEALAMKKPVVSTSLGCEGINVRHGESILVEDEPEAFANGIVKLMKDKDMVEQLTQNGYNLVKSNYDWNVIGDRMLEIYESLEVQENQKVLV